MYTLTYKRIADLKFAEIQRLREIATPYYEDASPVFGRDIQHCTHIYLLSTGSQIVAFFMVAWEKITIDGREFPALFLGLTCADRQLSISKTGAIFYQAVIDISEWRKANNRPLIMWCTTATPIVLKIVPKFWTLVAPSLDGTYDHRYAPIANAIREQYFAHSKPSNHPFVLKGVATATRYSEAEQAYLAKVTRKVNIPIFEQLGIDERKGDRLLMLMDVPDDAKLARHRTELAGLLKTSTLPMP